jgi:hypothetical protein
MSKFSSKEDQKNINPEYLIFAEDCIGNEDELIFKKIDVTQVHT